MKLYGQSSWLLYELGDMLDFKRMRGGRSQSQDVGVVRHATF